VDGEGSLSLNELLHRWIEAKWSLDKLVNRDNRLRVGAYSTYACYTTYADRSERKRARTRAPRAFA
jgi:hypothetical protein